MRPRRGPQLASVTFCVVIALAIVALSWGASRNHSSSHGIGTVAQRAAAGNTLAKGLVLPAGLVRDVTFTACGTPDPSGTPGASDTSACLTGTADVTGTLTALAAAFGAQGGSVGQTCTPGAAGASGGVSAPTFSCAVEGRLDGAWLLVLLGSGWQLPPVPGQPNPRTAVLIGVETAPTNAPAIHHAALPAQLPNVEPLLPTNWVSTFQPCASASPATSSAASPAASSTLPAGVVLPTCIPHMTTVDVAAPVAVRNAAGQLATTALAQGFRLDGRPCVTDPALKGCGVWGERISASGVQTLLVATLQDNGHGYMTGTVSLKDQS